MSIYRNPGWFVNKMTSSHYYYFVGLERCGANGCRVDVDVSGSFSKISHM